MDSRSMRVLAPDLEVNLEGYGRSPCFVGWNEFSKGISYERAVSMFLDLVEKLSGDVVLHTTLGWMDDPETWNLLPEDVLRCQKLVEAGWARRWDNASWDANAKKLGWDPLSDRLNQHVYGEEFCQVAVPEGLSSSAKNFASLLLLLVEEMCLQGHLFFVWPQHAIAFYCHDDRGFGCLSSAQSRVLAASIIHELPGSRLRNVEDLQI